MTDATELASPPETSTPPAHAAAAGRLLRPAAIVVIAGIALLSLVPGSLRLQTGASGNFEHALAYLAAAMAVGLAWRSSLGWRGPVAFSAFAGLLEIVQIFVPGRHAGIDNWAASTCGAVIGIALAATLRGRLSRHGGLASRSK